MNWKETKETEARRKACLKRLKFQKQVNSCETCGLRHDLEDGLALPCPLCSLCASLSKGDLSMIKAGQIQVRASAFMTGCPGCVAGVSRLSKQSQKAHLQGFSMAMSRCQVKHTSSHIQIRLLKSWTTMTHTHIISLTLSPILYRCLQNKKRKLLKEICQAQCTTSMLAP